MDRARRFTLLLAFLFSLPLVAQEQPALNMDQSVGSSVLQAPEQLRRVPPPPDDLSAPQLEARADILRAEKNYIDAIDYYRAAMRKQDSAVIENKWGISELQLFRIDEAMRRFERATKLDRNYADALNNLGVSYYIKRNYNKAIKEYRRAIKLNAESASFHSNLGSALFARKEFDKASEEYTQAMQLDPDIFNRQSATGVSAKLGSPEDRARFHYTIAKVLAGQGDTEHCLLFLRKAIEDGFPSIDNVYKDAAFAGILKDPRFVTLMASKPEAVK